MLIHRHWNLMDLISLDFCDKMHCVSLSNIPDKTMMVILNFCSDKTLWICCVHVHAHCYSFHFKFTHSSDIGILFYYLKILGHKMITLTLVHEFNWCYETLIPVLLVVLLVLRESTCWAARQLSSIIHDYFLVLITFWKAAKCLLISDIIFICYCDIFVFIPGYLVIA